MTNCDDRCCTLHTDDEEQNSSTNRNKPECRSGPRCTINTEAHFEEYDHAHLNILLRRLHHSNQYNLPEDFQPLVSRAITLQQLIILRRLSISSNQTSSTSLEAPTCNGWNGSETPINRSRNRSETTTHSGSSSRSSSEAPTYSERTPSETPTHSGWSSSEIPINSGNNSSETPTYSGRNPSETPTLSGRNSSVTPTYSGRNPSEIPINRGRNHSEIPINIVRPITRDRGTSEIPINSVRNSLETPINGGRNPTETPTLSGSNRSEILINTDRNSPEITINRGRLIAELPINSGRDSPEITVDRGRILLQMNQDGERVSLEIPLNRDRNSTEIPINMVRNPELPINSDGNSSEIPNNIIRKIGSIPINGFRNRTQIPIIIARRIAEIPINSDRNSTEMPITIISKIAEIPVNRVRNSSETPTNSGRNSPVTPTNSSSNRSETPINSGRNSSETPTHSGWSSSEMPTHSGRSPSETPTHSGWNRSETPTHSGWSSSEMPTHSGRSPSETPTYSGWRSSETPTYSGRNRSDQNHTQATETASNNLPGCSGSSQRKRSVGVIASTGGGPQIKRMSVSTQSYGDYGSNGMNSTVGMQGTSGMNVTPRIEAMPWTGGTNMESTYVYRIGSHLRLRPQDYAMRRRTSSSPEKKTSLVQDGDNYYRVLTMFERHEASAPYNFFLTPVNDFEETNTEVYSIQFCDILDLTLGELESSLHLNYRIDCDWLMSQYNPCQRDKPVTLLYDSLTNLSSLNIMHVHVHVPQSSQGGIHNTKMCVMAYKDNSVRVCVHTANLTKYDWESLVQGVWLSPACPALSPNASSDTGESPTGFKSDLIEYFLKYGLKELDPWIKKLRRTNFSRINVVFVASTPGVHNGEESGSWGITKMQKLLKKHVQFSPGSGYPTDWQIITQCSSIGNLNNQQQDSWYCSQFKRALSSRIGNPMIKLVYPSYTNAVHCRKGIPEGDSLYYLSELQNNQPWLLHHFYQWKSENRLRTMIMPHLNTYSRVSEDGSRMAWFLLSSASLSQSAWGVSSEESDCEISTYEAGVLFLPKFVVRLRVGCSSFPLTREVADNVPVFPMPFDVPLTPYGVYDSPWYYVNQHRHGD